MLIAYLKMKYYCVQCKTHVNEFNIGSACHIPIQVHVCLPLISNGNCGNSNCTERKLLYRDYCFSCVNYVKRVYQSPQERKPTAFKFIEFLSSYLISVFSYCRFVYCMVIVIFFKFLDKKLTRIVFRKPVFVGYFNTKFPLKKSR